MNLRVLVLPLLVGTAAVTLNPGRLTAMEVAPAPSKVRVISETSSDPQCAGGHAAPLCAVEEFIACWVKTPSHDCGNRPDSIVRDTLAWESLGHADSVEFSVESIHEFRPEDLTAKRPRAHRFPAGSVEIVLRQRLRPGRQASPEWQTGYYVVMRSDNDWQILDYSFTPWPDPSAAGRRWMSQGESSSNCIGNRSDPVCAVETLLACWLRRDGALCRNVIDCGDSEDSAALCRPPDDRRPPLDPSMPWPKHSLEYFVVEVRDPARSGLAPPDVPSREIWLRQFFLGPEGDQYILVPENDLAGLPTAPGPGYWVARIDGRWRIIGWGGELDD